MSKKIDRIVIRIDPGIYPDLHAKLYGAGPYKRAKVGLSLLLAGYDALRSDKSKLTKKNGEASDGGSGSDGWPSDNGGLLFGDEDIEL